MPSFEERPDPNSYELPTARLQRIWGIGPANFAGMDPAMFEGALQRRFLNQTDDDNRPIPPDWDMFETLRDVLAKKGERDQVEVIDKILSERDRW